ncbi:SH3 domain-containing protein [Neorhizobium galegae]|nr:SH3 domain-containing protein [Neorhizobium galegae]KAB1123564.1 SH3 domain-containing protein [Neorhizobium galegae]
MSVAALCALFVAPSIADAAVRGVATANVNMRSGPSTGYPAVDVIPVGAAVTIYGCMSSVNWCDVAFVGGRGWVSGNYVQASYRSNRVYVAPDYYEGLGIPMVTFDVGNYWGRYYRNRDFYRDRDRWDRYDWRRESRLPPPPPPPPRWDRDGAPRWDRDRSWSPGDRQPPRPPVWQGDRDRFDLYRDRVDRSPPPPRFDRRDENQQARPQRVERRDDRRGPLRPDPREEQQAQQPDANPAVQPDAPRRPCLGAGCNPNR